MQAQGKSHPYDPSRPWNPAFDRLTSDYETGIISWHQEFNQPATAIMRRQKTAHYLGGEAHVASSASQGAGRYTTVSGPGVGGGGRGKGHGRGQPNKQKAQAEPK